MDLYNWEQVPKEDLFPGFVRQVIHTPSMTLLRGVFKAGVSSPLHHHVHEQVTMIVQGKMRFFLDGEPVELQPGEVLRIPSDVPHSAEALEDSVLMDVFTPARTDWQ
ncbi:MAG TPA: cupin domain-containing protein [Granulicella sp.]